MTNSEAVAAQKRIRSMIRGANCPQRLREDVEQEAMVKILSGPEEFATTWRASFYAVCSAFRKISGQERRENKARSVLSRRASRADEDAPENTFLLGRMLELCDERERAIIEGRLSGLSLREMGEEFDLTSQRMHQIELKMRDRLRTRFGKEFE